MLPTPSPPQAPPPGPTLNPQFCLNTTALRDFLRLSRSTVDDSISAHLNALITPARTPFDPRSTASPMKRSAGRDNVPGEVCKGFERDVLFPSWDARERVLTYCSRVAEEEFAKAAQDQRGGEEGVSLNYWSSPQKVDERTDPYSGRDYGYTREGAAQVLRDVLRAEEGTEGVVKERTWRVLGERCVDGGGGKGWEGEWEEWRRRRA